MGVNIVKELGSYYTESMKRDLLDLVHREDKLRVSGFPYCGLKAAYEKMAVDKDPNTQAGKEFYTSVGTAAHLVSLLKTLIWKKFIIAGAGNGKTFDYFSAIKKPHYG